VALLYPELYKELVKGRTFSFKTFFTWLLISIYQGGTIMLLAIWLFESQFIHIVPITFTALILNELLMVALQVNTWHVYMIIGEFLSLAFYFCSLKFLPEDFDINFATSPKFMWKVSLITFVSFAPLFILNLLKRFINPPNYTKLS
jgi:phospholipid-translocating ATPase